MFSTFLHANDEGWSEVASIALGTTQGAVDISRRVGVSTALGPLLRIDIDMGGSHSCFQATVCSNGLVAIGYGDSLFVVNPTAGTSATIPCNGYFGHLYTPGDFSGEPQPFSFLCSSATDLISISPSGEVSWIAKDIALDGIVVTDVDTDTISGNAEWDPPGGWRPFKLWKATGESVA